MIPRHLERHVVHITTHPGSALPDEFCRTWCGLNLFTHWTSGHRLCTQTRDASCATCIEARRVSDDIKEALR